MSLAIQVGSGYLDLDDSAESFYINKQVFDLTNLTDRKATSSRALSIPFTDNNFSLLALEIPGFSPNQRGVNLVDCEVTLQGIPVFSRPRLKVEVSQSRRTININIVEGAATFFQRIPDAPLNQLSFSGEEEDFTITNLLTKVNTTSGFLFGRANWLTQQSGIDVRNVDTPNLFQLFTHVDVQQAGFFYYVRQVFEKIVNQTGFTIDYSELDSLFDELVFAVPMAKFFNGYQINQSTGYNGIAALSDFPITANTSTPQVPTLTPSQQSNINYVGNEFVVQSGFAGQAFITVNYKGNIKGKIRDPQFIKHFLYIRVNTALGGQYYVPFFGENASWEIRRSRTVYLNVGDTVAAAIVFDATNSAVSQQINFADAVENNELRISVTQFTFSEKRVDLGSWMPQVSQKAFVKAVFQLFGIVPVEEEGTIKLKYWNNVLQKGAKEFRLLLDSQFTETRQLQGYVENNVFKFDETNVTRDDTRSVITYGADLQNQERVILDNAFAPLDISTVYPFFDWHSVPAWNAQVIRRQTGTTIVFNPPNSYAITGTADVKEGDLIYASTVGIVRVVSVTDSNNGNVDASIGAATAPAQFDILKYTVGSYSPLHFATVVTKDATTNPWSIRDGNSATAVTGNFKSVEFLDTVKWEGLVNTYYPTLRASVEQPYVLQGFFKIDIDDFVTLDMLAPVFVPGLGQLFYINKMDQYKPDRPTRMTLISLQNPQ